MDKVVDLLTSQIRFTKLEADLCAEANALCCLLTLNDSV